MELQASRFPTRVDASVRWCSSRTRTDGAGTGLLIRHGLATLDRAIALGRPLGPYALQAAIAAAHARAESWEATDWNAIVALYDALAQLAPSPVVEVNRAVAVLMADGPEAALAVLDGVRDDPRLARLPPARRRSWRCAAPAGSARARRPPSWSVRRQLAPTRHERILLMERAASAGSVDP